MIIRRKRTHSDTLVEPPRRTRDEIDNYLVLCVMYREMPVCDHMGPNPHSVHAKELEERSTSRPRSRIARRTTRETIPVKND